MEFKRQTSIFLFIAALILTKFCYADHYLGGFFTYQFNEGNNSFTIQLHTFTDAEANQSDRDSVEINFGDNVLTHLLRVNNDGAGEVLYDGVKYNIYETQYSYNQFNHFQLTFSDQFRVNDIRNMDRSVSAQTNLYVTSVIPFEDPETYCQNNSPIPTSLPMFKYLENDDVHINFGMYDEDGDSLVYELIPTRGRNGNPGRGYFTPNEVIFNEATGALTWNKVPEGDWGFGIKVKEYREETLIAEHTYDFTIRVSSFLNPQPLGSINTSNLIFTSDNQTESITWLVEHENSDSLWIDVLGSVSIIDAFEWELDTLLSNESQFNTQVNLTFENEHIYTGTQNMILRMYWLQNGDTLYKDWSVGVSSIASSEWACLIPEFEEAKEVIPELPVFGTSTTIFSEGFWINTGEQTEDLTVEFYDIRGRLVDRYENIEIGTFKIITRNLRPAIYVLLIYRGEELRERKKMIKY